MRLILIYLTAFVVGFVIMGFEFFGTRVLSPYFGGGLHVWGALISVVMGGLSCGYIFGGVAADKRSPGRLLIHTLLVSGLLLLLFPCFSIFVCRWIDSFQMDPKVSTLLASFLLFFAPSFFMGCVSPLLVKLKVASLDDVGQGSGAIYAIVTIGSIAGTIVTAFFLIGRCSSSGAIALFGGGLIANAAVLFVFHYFYQIFTQAEKKNQE